MKREDNLKKIIDEIPMPNGVIDWSVLSNSALGELFSDMEKTEQAPEYHGEGNVLNHTKMVAEAIIRLPIYRESSERDRVVLFLAALLHDIGKIRCTRLKEGKLASPNHGAVGARMARSFMFEKLGMSGNDNLRSQREAICSLIRYHSFPPFAIKSNNPEFKILKIAANGELTPDFSLRKLCALEEADAIGRIGSSTGEYLERTEYCRMLAEELGVCDKPYEFSTPFSERAYFIGKTLWRGAELYKNTDFEVTLMSGLPGTGKDTWIEKNLRDIPMVSLDEIRTKYKISPLGPQGEVAAIAKEQARELLRKKQPFVWNATNISYDIREKLISLFEDYGASVRTVFLETEWDEGISRNRGREKEVPESAIRRMLDRIETPERFESEVVEWYCV